MIEVLDKGYVELIDVMGDEKRIANVARISYGKTEGKYDEKLLKLLLRNGHMSPFEQVQFTFKVKCPIFIARQFQRHRTGCLASETTLVFDEPRAVELGTRKIRCMSVGDFYNKWENGSISPKPLRKRQYDLTKIDDNKIYTIHEFCQQCNCKDITTRATIKRNHVPIVSENPRKILGKDLKECFKDKTAKWTVDLKSRLKAMNIRLYDRQQDKVVYSHIKDIWCSGVKDIYKYTFENGYSINCTENHTFLTEKGENQIEICYKNQIPIYTCSAKGVSNETPIHYTEHELENEVWKPVVNYEDKYIVSNLGRVKSLVNTHNRKLKIPKLKKQSILNTGYPVVSVSRNGKSWAKPIHSLVCEAFISCKKDKKMVIRHLDGNKLNCRLSNLSYDNYKKNIADKITLNETAELRGILTKVVKKEFVRTDKVYDLEIEGNNPYFITNEGIVTHNSYNEQSRRYTKKKWDYYVPDLNRLPNKNTNSLKLQKSIIGMYEFQIREYEELIKFGVLPEVARCIMGTGFYTTFFFTVDLRNLLHFLDLRTAQDAQFEIREYADVLEYLVEEKFPNVIQYWRENK